MQTYFKPHYLIKIKIKSKKRITKPIMKKHKKKHEEFTITDVSDIEVEMNPACRICDKELKVGDSVIRINSDDIKEILDSKDEEDKQKIKALAEHLETSPQELRKTLKTTEYWAAPVHVLCGSNLGFEAITAEEKQRRFMERQEQIKTLFLEGLPEKEIRKRLDCRKKEVDDARDVLERALEKAAKDGTISEAGRKWLSDYKGNRDREWLQAQAEWAGCDSVEEYLLLKAYQSNTKSWDLPKKTGQLLSMLDCFRQLASEKGVEVNDKSNDEVSRMLGFKDFTDFLVKTWHEKYGA